MNEVKLTVELCAEDRARLDNLLSLLTTSVAQQQLVVEAMFDKQDEAKTKDFLSKAFNLAKETLNEEAPKIAQDAPKATDHPTLDPFPETPTAKAEANEEPVKEEPVKEEKPAVTMDMLRSKAITLAAAGKKDQVRDVVHPYAPKVTELPEDKWGKVYAKLCALEG